MRSYLKRARGRERETGREEGKKEKKRKSDRIKEPWKVENAAATTN